jgi:hypothetical protein
MEEWLFHSCAVHGMAGMTDYYHPSVPWTTELVDALIHWFKEVKGAQGGWAWREVLFCVTAYQRDHLKGLVTHPNTKLLDVFTNKAHGGAKMHLYRLSVDKDFKSVK